MAAASKAKLSRSEKDAVYAAVDRYKERGFTDWERAFDDWHYHQLEKFRYEKPYDIPARAAFDKTMRLSKEIWRKAFVYNEYNPRRRKNGLLDFFKTKETVYPMRRGTPRRIASGRTTLTPRGTEIKYQGVRIRKTPDGDYATSIDWDSRFDSLTDAKHFVKSWQEGMRNPRPQDIVYESGDYFVVRAAKGGFEIYRNGATGAVRVSQVGYTGQKGLDWARNEIDRRQRQQSTHNPVVTSCTFQAANPATRAALLTLVGGKRRA